MRRWFLAGALIVSVAPTAFAGLDRDGLSVLRAIGAGELPLPPAVRTLGLEPVDAHPGRVTFRLEPDDRTAIRTQVTLGRTSVTMVEIVEGLKVGDKVILSDTSQWDNVDRIVLN